MESENERMNKFMDWIAAKAFGLIVMAISAAYIGLLAALFWRCFLLGWDILQ